MNNSEGRQRCEAIIAGHICLDIIPAVGPEAAEFRPGQLLEAGAAVVSTGGAVSNTGIALHKLGVDVRLVAKIGDDSFGTIVSKLLREQGAQLTNDILVSPSEHTSYTVVISPPGFDRMFLHSTGCNAGFRSEDLPNRLFESARLLHFGYPPLMESMYEFGGRELVDLLRRAKNCGLTTSLDMAMPDLGGPAGNVDWPGLLRASLPYVDVFMPSAEELSVMLVRELRPEEGLRRDQAGEMSQWAIDQGAAIVGLKCGDQGLCVRTGSPERITQCGASAPRNVQDWSNRHVWVPCFEVEAAGSTGSGDATISGFLMGLLRGLSFSETVRAAAAVGAYSVEAPDATSGIRSWQETNDRIRGGWRSRTMKLDPVRWAWNSDDSHFASVELKDLSS